MLPKPYFDKERWYQDFLRKHLGSREETNYIPGYGYTFLEFKKILLESPLEYTSDGGLVFSALGLSFTLDGMKEYMVHGEWDDPSFTPNERELAYRIHLLEQKICDLVCGSKNTS